MKDFKIPSGYQTVMPYIILRDAEGFLKFTKEVFNATEKMKSFREGERIIAHAEIQIRESIIMCAEASENWGIQTAGLFIYVTDADQTYNDALKNGATSIMEPADQSYGRSCGVKDPYGVTWWITTAN